MHSSFRAGHGSLGGHKWFSAESVAPGLPVAGGGPFSGPQQDAREVEEPAALRRSLLRFPADSG